MRSLDHTDRRLLGLLQDDANQKYADLGERLNLSAPAVHERVKKLRRAGVIRRTKVDLDADALGFPICAFVKLKLAGGAVPGVVGLLDAMPFVEEAHVVSGSACMILRVRAPTPLSLEQTLAQIHLIEAVRDIESFVVLNTYLERPVSPLAAAEADLHQ
ncbi:MAG: Lrp/AsnC family transcriptional regulator [Pseudomonadota bacterium]